MCQITADVPVFDIIIGLTLVMAAVPIYHNNDAHDDYDDDNDKDDDDDDESDDVLVTWRVSLYANARTFSAFSQGLTEIGFIR